MSHDIAASHATWTRISRVFAFIAARVVLVSEVTTFIANKRVLFGTTSPNQISNVYASRLMVSHLMMVHAEPTKTLEQRLAPTTTPTTPYVVYLDAANSSLTKATPQRITVPATYSVTIGFTFPYEWDTFQFVTLDDLIPPTGTTGIYHGSPTVEANFGFYYWDLPSNPIAFLGAIQFVYVYVRKDVWGWFRCCLGLGIGFNIAVNTLVSLVVVVNVWRSSRSVWIPDAYPAIQRRACLRAILLLVDCVVTNWWYTYTFALNQGGFRTNWVSTLFLDEIVRADGLMICLAIVYGAAKLLRVRLKLFVIVAIYVVLLLATVARQSIRWSSRYLRFNALTDLNTVNTHIESSVSLVVSDISGFVASTIDCETNPDNIPFVLLSGVWLLGFVVVNDQAIND
ncbi:Aste57867_11915 [Aphanomyces stellatus]|uniref:Aste57867_11915 protein n=1 Tax=Aphanomyces stellatus TaxID=120398 RepID=A0A485KUA8_9STRA|nr:hypothetical protein As57867_011870 [Aphanomyces stellatus]VFT88770.1 Aste57867_11915 [Aphanomyces stellatus]